MQLIRFPLERVIDINEQILKTEVGFKGVPDLGKLQGALSRIDNAIWYKVWKMCLRSQLNTRRVLL